MKSKLMTAFLMLVSASAFADFSIVIGHPGHPGIPNHPGFPGHVQPWNPGHPIHPGHPGGHGFSRIVSISGQGSGGSTHGDKRAACDRAQQRARADAYSDCARMRGQVLNVYAGSCSCSGPKKDTICRTRASGSCRVYRDGWYSLEMQNADIDFTRDLVLEDSAAEFVGDTDAAEVTGADAEIGSDFVVEEIAE